ncbi:MAG: hypothetical protein AAGD13_07895 [Pseudomonadota bacterium]
MKDKPEELLDSDLDAASGGDGSYDPTIGFSVSQAPRLRERPPRKVDGAVVVDTQLTREIGLDFSSAGGEEVSVSLDKPVLITLPFDGPLTKK